MGMIQKAIPFHRFDHSPRKREGRKIRNGDRESHFPSQIVSSTRARDSEKQGGGEGGNKVKYPIKFLRLHNGVNNCL